MAARKAESNVEMRGTGRIYRPPATRFWWADYYDHGKRIRLSTGTEKRSEANDFLIAKLEDVRRRNGPARDLTLFDLEQAMLADYKIRRQTSADKVTIAFAKLVDVLALKPKKALARDLRAEQLSVFAAERLRGGARPATVRNELAVVKRAFNLLKDSDLVPPRFPTISIGDNARRGVLEWQDLVCIREHLAPYKRPIVTFQFYTGWRISEVVALTWAQVDFENEVVFLEPWQVKGKSRASVRRYFSFKNLPDLGALLREQREATSALERERRIIVPTVFHWRGRKVGRSVLRSDWKPACEKCGVAAAIDHDFRRTAARNLALAGVNPRVICDMVGWKSAAMFYRYFQPRLADQEIAGEQLQARLSELRKAPRKVEPIRLASVP